MNEADYWRVPQNERMPGESWNTMGSYQHDVAPREFHISRAARDRYQFDQLLFGVQGEVVFANFHAARMFAVKMNATRDLANHPEQTVRAGQINALGLIDEIIHLVIGAYCREVNSPALAEALAALDTALGVETVDTVLHRFCELFPPLAVYRGECDVAEYLTGATGDTPHRVLALEELVLLWLSNQNPACRPYIELFDDTALREETAYTTLLAGLQAHFVTQPAFGPEHLPLLDLLRRPAIAVPDSLTGQLEYILAHWGAGLLGHFLYRLLGGLDLIKEEDKAIFFGPGPAQVYDFTGLDTELERFSPDKDWMPRAVILAKNTYVWLDQLSKRYGREIHRLDEIPDEELDTLAQRGFTCLWLIGLWERSYASQRIKQMCGNPDAVASAYSLMSYDPATDLGGDDALQSFRARAWARGLRLASDMVPNHMGIDSKWVIEHPDWFISTDVSPFPTYTFTGPNLSWDDRVGIFLEDHYYSRNDAAVVFKRVDFWSGHEQYIYHGNDGTSMPWNDTAQLNYLLPAVREAVIQTILHVARNFPVIRFDAAMTLAQRHYQRLWFPEPGSGGDIPSRAEHGMSRERFHEVFPVEFWREVVDRVAAEAPDTLLLAEAFWLMEGYFVRTLGMHRVYNSAFMNMMRDEDNAKYRSVLKNTMEFDIEILKRYVNFMNNPDERTAIDQFGDGDKYFGACVMLSTLPGLPMFGHGQVEGFTEKYGMEYRRAYWDEHPNTWLEERHAREIFPLLHRRQVFAEATHFSLYDLFTPEGHVNEDVFAYSNRSGEECGLVLFHNKWAEARGWINMSAAFAMKHADGSKTLAQRTLGESLGVLPEAHTYTIFRDMVTGLEYIRNSRDLCVRGLYVELGAFRYHVFMDFRQVPDNVWRHYGNVCAYLDGRGVPSIDEALRELFLQPVHDPVKMLLNANLFERAWAGCAGEVSAPELLAEVESKTLQLAQEILRFSGTQGDGALLAVEVRETLAIALTLPSLAAQQTDPVLAQAMRDIAERLDDHREWWGILFGWIVLHALGKLATADYAAQSRSWIDEWLLGRILAEALREFGLGEDAAWHAVHMVKILTEHQRWFEIVDTTLPPAAAVLEALLADPVVQGQWGINRYQDILWFNQQAVDETLWWLEVVALLALVTDTTRTDRGPATFADVQARAATLIHAATEAEYRVETLRRLVRSGGEEA